MSFIVNAKCKKQTDGFRFTFTKLLNVLKGNPPVLNVNIQTKYLINTLLFCEYELFPHNQCLNIDYESNIKKLYYG